MFLAVSMVKDHPPVYENTPSRCSDNDDDADDADACVLMMKSKCENNLEFSGYAGGRGG